MSKNSSLKERIAHHSLAILSLFIAIIALTYNTWRSDTTEYNRNIRTASFELIKQLGSLQNITHELHYSQPEQLTKDRKVIIGWGHIALIEDLSALLPVEIRQHSQQLKAVWQKEAVNLGIDANSEVKLSETIIKVRAETRKLLISLD